MDSLYFWWIYQAIQRCSNRYGCANFSVFSTQLFGERDLSQYQFTEMNVFVRDRLSEATTRYFLGSEEKTCNSFLMYRPAFFPSELPQKPQQKFESVKLKQKLVRFEFLRKIDFIRVQIPPWGLSFQLIPRL